MNNQNSVTLNPLRKQKKALKMAELKGNSEKAEIARMKIAEIERNQETNKKNKLLKLKKQKQMSMTDEQFMNEQQKWNKQNSVLNNNLKEKEEKKKELYEKHAKAKQELYKKKQGNKGVTVKEKKKMRKEHISMVKDTKGILKNHENKYHSKDKMITFIKKHMDEYNSSKQEARIAYNEQLKQKALTMEYLIRELMKQESIDREHATKVMYMNKDNIYNESNYKEKEPKQITNCAKL